MSSAEIQRLEGLLERVQHNRQVARPTAPAVDHATASPLERTLESRVATPVGTSAPKPFAAPQPPAVSRPAPVAAPIAKPVAQPVAQAKAPAPVAAAPVIAASPAPIAALDPNVPVRIATSAASPSRSIASAVSPHPTMDAPSFRELLRRTLSLRPR